MTDAPAPGYYAGLDFNAPLSDQRADSIARALAARRPRTFLDVGCGWGELLLRTVAVTDDATGLGVDSDERALARARANAATRGLDGRVTFESGDAAAMRAAADAVICVGADHAFGDQAAALAALRGVTAPGGVMLFGSGFWQRPPSDAQAGSIGMEPDSLTDLAGLVDMTIEHGFRPLTIQSANRDEWERFESGYLSDWEEWLVAHGDRPGADEIRTKADTHRNEWLRGYRDVIGFAYLMLGRGHE